MTNFNTEIYQIKISSAINEFVQLFKDNQMLKNKTLAVDICISVSDHSEEKVLTKNIYKNICLLFQCKCNYVTVCWAKGSKFDIKEIVNFEACHDSCWRDGTDRVIRKAICELEQDLCKEGVKEKDYKFLSIFNSFGIGGADLMNYTLESNNNNYETKKSKIIRNHG